MNCVLFLLYAKLDSLPAEISNAELSISKGFKEANAASFNRWTSPSFRFEGQDGYKANRNKFIITTLKFSRVTHAERSLAFLKWTLKGDNDGVLIVRENTNYPQLRGKQWYLVVFETKSDHLWHRTKSGWRLEKITSHYGPAIGKEVPFNYTPRTGVKTR